MSRSVVLKSSLQSNYSMTTSFAEITGLKITIPEDGLYHVIGSLSILAEDSNGLGQDCVIKLAIDGNTITASGGRVGSTESSNAESLSCNVSISNYVYLKKDQVITVYGKMASDDDGGTVYASGTNYSSYIEACKVG